MKYAPLALGLLVIGLVTPASAAENLVVRIGRLITLLGEDADFRKLVEKELEANTELRQLPAKQKAALLAAVSAEGYLDELTALYRRNVKEEAIDAAIAFLSTPANRSLYRDLFEAHSTLQGEELAARRNELRQRDPAAWAAAATFFQSDFARARGAMDGEVTQVRTKLAIVALIDASHATEAVK